MSIKQWPEGERPREKLLARGAGALSDAELLAILLRVGTRGMSAVDLARYLLNEFGSLGKLMSADAKTLSAYKGMGLASFTQFAVVKEIGRRILGEDLQENITLSSPKAVADYLRLHLGHEKIEVSTALLLSLIIAHNHPGGSATPSQSDIAFTGRLKQALALVDVSLLDHFIVTATEACSMREQGYMEG